jgi:hypothetical protein
LCGWPGDHDVGQLALELPIRSQVVEAAAGDEHRQQVRLGGDDVEVESPRLRQFEQTYPLAAPCVTVWPIRSWCTVSRPHVGHTPWKPPTGRHVSR